MKRLNKVPEAGANAQRNAAQVGDLMTSSVITVTRHQTVGHVRDLMAKHGIHAVPVVSGEQEPVGVLTSTDMIDAPADDTLLGQMMTRDVHTVTQYSGVHTAARLMRKHRIHHLIVTHEKKVVGIVSSFDLLQLVEDRRFVMKSHPPRPQKGGGQRRRQEDDQQD